MLQLCRKQTIIEEIHKQGVLPLWEWLKAASSMMVCFLGKCNIHEFTYNFHAYKSSLKLYACNLHAYWAFQSCDVMCCDVLLCDVHLAAVMCTWLL